MCAAIRLARFNVQRKVVDGRYFVGLPSPAAAGFVIAVVYFRPAPLSDRLGAAFTMALLVVGAFLMVSTLRYWSFKTLDLRSRRSYFAMVGVAALLALVATEPSPGPCSLWSVRVHRLRSRGLRHRPPAPQGGRRRVRHRPGPRASRTADARGRPLPLA
jgi:phosphatidylserine synthase